MAPQEVLELQLFNLQHLEHSEVHLQIWTHASILMANVELYELLTTDDRMNFMTQSGGSLT